MKNQSHRLKLLISAALAAGSGLSLAQDFDFANDGRLTAPIYRYGDTAGNGQFWDGQELGDNNLQFQYTGAGQAGTYVFGIDGTFTTPSINVLNGSTFGSIVFGDTGGNSQLWSQQELVDNTFQLIYQHNLIQMWLQSLSFLHKASSAPQFCSLATWQAIASSGRNKNYWQRLLMLIMFQVAIRFSCNTVVQGKRERLTLV